MEGAVHSSRPAAPLGSQAIERALGVLDCFMASDAELGITEIARRLQLSPSTVHRIVRALLSAGYLDQNPRTDQYYLGRSAVLLGQFAQRAMGMDQVLPVLEEVAERTGESVNFGIREDGSAIVALRVETRHALRFEQQVGTRVPLYCSALGKALLAFGADPVADVRALGRLERFTQYTITGKAALERELRDTRERGYSLDEQEKLLGVRCIGAPVLEPGGHARAAIAVQIPSVRMPRDDLPGLAPVVTGAAARIADLLHTDRAL
jgi:IclR family transcriptional regulator, acetate operon repressor